MAKREKFQVDKSATILKGSGAQGKEGARTERFFYVLKKRNFGCLKPQELDHKFQFPGRTPYFISVDNFHGSGQEGVGLVGQALHLSL